MIIGIPKESWGEERRVALTPAGAHALERAGHSVIVQSEAGSGSGFSAEAYREAGATIVFSAEEIFARAEFWWCVAGIAVTGALNVGVSFYLAFKLALRAQGVRVTDRARIARAVRRRLRRRPLSFLLPPKSA